MVSRPPKAELAAGWCLQSSFRESQLCAKTLSEGATSPEDPSHRRKPWFKLKTRLAEVKWLKKGPSVRLDHRALRCNPPEKPFQSPQGQFQPNKPIGHRFSII
jgi:hypothetical protein